MSEPTTVIHGVTVEEGRVIARGLDQNGRRQEFDLTGTIEAIAERKVQEHMRKFHGHQL